MSSFLNDFISLLYPNLCLGCKSHLNKKELNLCLYCRCNLPKTDFSDITDNKTEKLLWGRINFEAATSFLYFSKKGITQRLLHQLKYKNQEELGVELGQLFGAELKISTRFNQLDSIVPIPLHPKKQKERGYNQSQKISEGLSKSLQIPIIESNLIRIKNHSSQTGKNRINRWEGLKEDFIIANPEEFENKKILIVDDVITTGATLEACSSLFSKITNAKLYIATLAIPVN